MAHFARKNRNNFIRTTPQWKTVVYLAILSVIGFHSASAINKECDGVGFMPRQLLITGAKDIPALPPLHEGEPEQELVDVHLYNHFYTFQVDRDPAMTNEGVEMSLLPPSTRASSSEGYAFRLRSEFNSAEMSRGEMGFRVALWSYSERDDWKVEGEASSLNTTEGLGTVTMDIPSLPEGKEYALKYEFYEKEVLRKGNSLSLEEDSISTNDPLVQCNLPFFTQELTLVDRKVLNKRVRKYMQSDVANEQDISKATTLCRFQELDYEATSQDSEGGLSCPAKTYTYALNPRLGVVDSKGLNLREIASYPIRISGAHGEPVTQYLKMTVGSEFAFGAGLKVLLRRDDSKILSENDKAHPFACLLDASCQLARRSEKNHQHLNVVLTSGDYLLQFFDHSSDKYNRWLQEDLELSVVPFSFNLEVVPILQNEERLTCPYMYLMEDLVQSKFVEGQTGQKFSFSDKIIMNLADLRQFIHLAPELDSSLKVVVREQFGVNTQISLVKQSDKDQVIQEGIQVGTTDILYVEKVPKGEKVAIKLDYSHSILAFHTFTTCPHISVEISMISVAEKESIAENRVVVDGGVRESKRRLRSIISEMSSQAAKTLSDPDREGRFVLSSKRAKSFEVLASKEFEVQVKMGLFAEIFYSPYDDEVLELYVSTADDLVSDFSVSDPADCNDEEDDQCTQILQFPLAKYKSSKTVWVELEPGNYVVQVLLFRQPSLNAPSAGEGSSEKVPFQLYMHYDFVNTAREVFFPASLNYHGLLGYKEETRDFGLVTLFYDDLTLWHKTISTTFAVQSEMASVSLQLQQETDLVKIRLYEAASGSATFRPVGEKKTFMGPFHRIEEIQVPQLSPEKTYKLEVFKDGFSEHAQIEDVEMGERYGTSFSLKIEFTENDDESVAQQVQKRARQKLPKSIDEISKVKRSVQGLRESAFWLGNRSMLKLLSNSGSLAQDPSAYVPYLPKTQQIWTHKKFQDTVVASLPFEVEGLEETIFVGLYEFSLGRSMLSAHVLSAETRETVAMSEQGKYFSALLTVLPTGKYVLVIRNDAGQKAVGKEQAPIDFLIDVMRSQVPDQQAYMDHFLEAMMVCSVPQTPTSGLTQAGYIHPLGGHQMQTVMKFSLLELDSGATLPFTIPENSVVTAYIEASEDIPLALAISETGGIKKSVALSSDQDKSQSNFIKQEGFKRRNVVELRELLGKGSYWIQAKAVSFEDMNLSFDQRQSFCETFTLHISISSLRSATKPWPSDSEEEFCEGQAYLSNQLTLNEMTKGSVVHELSTMNTDVGYFDFSKTAQEGPFLVYFQVDYNMRQEGVVAVALSQYDADSSSFRESALFTLSDSQSTLLTIVERGTYAISIQSIASTPAKLHSIGISERKLKSLAVTSDYCLRAEFTYLISSVNEKDTKSDAANGILSFASQIPYSTMLQRVIVMETADDLRNLHEFQTCNYDAIPRRFPISDDGFDRQYTFSMSSGTTQVIDLVIEEASFAKVFISPRNPKNLLKAQLHRPGRGDDFEGRPIGVTDPVDFELHAQLPESQKAYHLKLIYSYLDPEDTCPLFDLHIAVKAMSEIAEEDLVCEKHDLPPETIKVDRSLYKLDTTFSFGYEYLIQEADASTQILDYDILIEFPHADYFFDVEIKSDFLTSNMHMELFAKDPQSASYSKIAQSYWFNEHSEDDLASGTPDIENLKVGERTQVQRLRYLEDELPDYIQDSASLLLRIKMKPWSLKLVSKLKKGGYLDTDDEEPLCFNFDFSFYAHEKQEATINDANANKLVRVDWIGPKESAKKFDSSAAITAYLEFEKSMSQHSPVISQSYADVYLQPIERESGRDLTSKKKVNPAGFKLKAKQDSVMMLFFSPFAMEKGQCYQLRFQSGGSLSQFVSGSIESGEDLIVCASSCNCDPVGTRQCIEDNISDGGAFCHCHKEFEGPECGRCKAGHFKNDDGYCEKQTRCEELGGTVDCNGHGVCIQDGPVARCECHPGFSDDGLDQCGRCSDPLFQYPGECAQRRQWILEQDDYECSELPAILPTRLYKKIGEDDGMRIIYQQDNGELEWAGRYALKHKTNHRAVSVETDVNEKTQRDLRKSSVHRFLVPTTSMFRLYVNTLESNVKAKYTIQDSQNNILYQTDSFETSFIEFGTLKQEDDQANARAAPYTLTISYEHELRKEATTSEDCPLVEIHFVLQPVTFQINSLRCTAEEREASKVNELEQKYRLDQNLVLQKTVTVTSKQRPGGPGSILSESDIDLNYISIELEVPQDGGVFSVIAMTDFSDLNVFLELTNSEHRIIAIEKSYMLDEVQTNNDPGLNGDEGSAVAAKGAYDMLHSIEVPDLAKGKYKLRIGLPKAYWIKQRGFETCLSFQLMAEYLIKKSTPVVEDEEVEVRPYTVVAAAPGQKDLVVGGTMALTVVFDQDIDYRNIAGNLPDASRICRLQSMVQDNMYINPARQYYRKKQGQLHFEFAKDSERIKTTYNSNGKTEESSCYKLKCVNEPMFEGGSYILPLDASQNFKYCFTNIKRETETYTGEYGVVKCNPYAKAKVEKDGSCVCTYPYTGNDCEQCMAGYKATKTNTRIGNVKQKHTVCVAEEESDEGECNGFGTWNKRSKICSCQRGYSGIFCEACTDSRLTYPECVVENYDSLDEEEKMTVEQTSVILREYAKQRKQQVYQADYLMQDRGSIFQQQCHITDYPNYLNQITNHKEFESGDFHMAEHYMTNHDADNVIEFTPRTKGTFKILVKQPELEEVQSTDDSFAIEIGVSKSDGTSFLRSVSNYEIDMKGAFGKTGLEFTQLTFEVNTRLVDEPLLIYFRSTNFTHDSLSYEAPQCQLLYIEIEYRSDRNMHQCDSEYPAQTSTSSPIVISQGYSSPSNDKIFTLTHTDNADDQPFFYSQDYYVSIDEAMQEYDLLISLEQKFIDKTTILPILEVLAENVDLDDYDSSAFRSRQFPKCKIQCLVGGHKTFNQMSIMATLPAGTVFRLWLNYQLPLNPGRKMDSCSNYQLRLETRTIQSLEHDEELQNNLRCEHTNYLPETLNTVRYLGSVEASTQQDFDYIENFRVDNVHRTAGTKFSLKERTIVRIDGFEHASLQFRILIQKGRKQLAATSSQKLPDTKVEAMSSIFIVLDEGDYTLRLSFASSNSHIVRQPCQSVQLQMAFNRADASALYPLKSSQQSYSYDGVVNDISVKNFFGESDSAPTVFEAQVRTTSDEEDRYQIILDQEVKFADKAGQNLLIKVNSDFLRADINFVLINQDSGHTYRPQHRLEDTKKLLIIDLPPGVYRLIIFAQNLVKSNGVSLKQMQFNFKMSLWSFEKAGRAQIQYKPAGSDEYKTKRIAQKFTTPEKLLCMASNRQLPDDLTKDVYSNDFALKFAVPDEAAFASSHSITYRPAADMDVLRVQIDEGIRMRLFAASDMNNAVATSHNKLGENIHELVAKQLSSSHDYVLVLVFSDEDDPAGLGTEQCIEVMMQVRIASSKDGAEGCLTGSLNDKTRDLPTEIKMLPGTGLQSSTKTLQMVSDFRGASRRAQGSSVPRYTVELTQETQDLEIIVDQSNLLYGANVVLYDGDDSQLETENLALRRVYGSDQNVIQPHMIITLKHQTKWVYTNLEAGKYKVRAIQPQKPSSCLNIIDVVFKVTDSIESLLNDFYRLGDGSADRYMSKEEEWNGVFRLPSALPIDLNSLRFMGGGSTEDNYILFSDLFELNDDAEKNKISLKIQNSDTIVRMYYEDSKIKLNQRCWDRNENFIGEKSITSQLLSVVVDAGRCEWSLEHFTKEAHSRRVFLNEKTQLTIMVADPKFYRQQYSEFHGVGLTECSGSQWPLALTKQTEWSAVTEEQAAYNYPLIRYPQNRGGANWATEMTSYYFRFNETQRLYFEAGSNFIDGLVTLRLSATQKSTNWAIKGKQIGNVNMIDIELPPGDYQLTILGYTSLQNICGMYSLRGILNQNAAMNQHLPGGSALTAGATSCELKSEDEAPLIIYKNAEGTRKGNEDVIDEHGAFFKQWQNLLIVKTHQEVLEPWTHEVQLEVPETSILTVTISSKQADNMMVRLMAAMTGSKFKPEVSVLRETATDVIEITSVFKVEAGRNYLLEIEFTADMYNLHGEQEQCQYYDLGIAVNSLKGLAQKLSCTAEGGINNDLPRLLDELPETINDQDLDFSMEGIYKVNYPNDFKKVAYKNNGVKRSNLSKQMMFTTTIDTPSAFTFKSDVVFDLPWSGFSMSLVEVSGDSQDGDFELIARSSPTTSVSNDKEDITFSNSIRRTKVEPAQSDDEHPKYVLMIQEDFATYIFNEVAGVSELNNLCLRTSLQLSVKRRGQKAAIPPAGAKREVVDYRYMMASAKGDAEHMIVPFNIKNIDVSTLYSTDLLDGPALMDLRAFALDVVANGRVVQSYLPVNVEKTANRQAGMYTTVTSFKLDLGSVYSRIRLAQEVSLKYRINELALSGDNSQPFELSEKLKAKAETYRLDVELPSDLKAKLQEKEKLEGQQVHDTLEDVIEEEVISKREKREKRKSELIEDAKAKRAQKEQAEAVAEEKISDRIRRIKEESDSSEKQAVVPAPVKCMCVHGHCAEGKSYCKLDEPCQAGWKGHLCDVPDEKNEKKKASAASSGKGPKRAKVIDDDEEDEIFSVRRIDDDDYTDTATSSQNSRAATQSNNYKVVTATEDNSWGNQRAVNSARQDVAQMDKPVNLQQSQQKEGWFMWMFHSFVSLVQWVLWLAGALIILVILKYCYEQATEKVAAKKTKRRTGKRKRNEDLEGDGLSFAGGVTYSDSDDDVQQPIEMTAFNRKKPTKKRSDSGADYKELTPSRSNELKLFDNDDDPSTQPQEVKKKKKKAPRGEEPQQEAAGGDSWDPFGANNSQAQTQSHQEGSEIQMNTFNQNYQNNDLQSNVQQLGNEIDDALNDSGEDEGDEFSSFV